MHLGKLRARRPSAAMLVASIALFVALGGVGYAAVNIPNGSVGTAQLKNAAVTGQKIKAGAVGAKQINSGQVQARVKGTCDTGVTSISPQGKVVCGGAAALNYRKANQAPVPVGSASTVVLQSDSLPSGPSYLVTANPEINIAGVATGESVTVSCKLAAGTSADASQVRRLTVDVGPACTSQVMDLTIEVPSQPQALTESLACVASTTGTTTPSVTALTAINALEVVPDFSDTIGPDPIS